MINIQLEKNAIKKSSTEEKVLMTLRDNSERPDNIARKALNIGIAIDISGSMSEDVNFSLSHRFNTSTSETLPYSKTRLEQAKMVVLKTLDNMHDGDVLSITAFNHTYHDILDPVVIDKDNRYKIAEAVNSMEPSGMTDLYSGWLRAVESVASNIDKEKVNRILLISDGDITAGVNDVEKISQDVRSISKKGVSTSTFGIGSGFNETLLEAMADASSANSYYVEDESSMNKVFEDEFNDFNNISGTDVSITFDLNKGISVKDNLCDFKTENGDYLIPNIRRNNNVYALFSLGIDDLGSIESKNGEVDLGSITLCYKDSKGDKQTITEELQYLVLPDEVYEQLTENEEVFIQDILMEVARTKREATTAIDNNNMEEAQNILDKSRSYLEEMNRKYKDNRIETSLRTTERTLLTAKDKDHQTIRKEMSSQAYMTTRSMAQ